MLMGGMRGHRCSTAMNHLHGSKLCQGNKSSAGCNCGNTPPGYVNHAVPTHFRTKSEAEAGRRGIGREVRAQATTREKPPLRRGQRRYQVNWHSRGFERPKLPTGSKFSLVRAVTYDNWSSIVWRTASYPVGSRLVRSATPFVSENNRNVE
jgi:hypothetical protein